MQPIVRILIVVSSTSLWVGELYFDVEKKPVIISIVRLLISVGSGWMLNVDASHLRPPIFRTE